MTIPPLRQCAILAGGLGSRLGALTRDTPKPLLEVGGRPFLAWVMQEALRWGIEEFVLLTGHLGATMQAEVIKLQAGLPRPTQVTISNEPAPAGTGGALYHARNLLADRFLLLNGDSLFLTDLRAALMKFACDGPDIACRMVLRNLADAGRYGVVELAGDQVTTFMDRPNGSDPALINTGIYLMQRSVAERALPACSLERDLLPVLAAQGAVRGTVAAGWFIDIGIPSDLDLARAELASHVKSAHFAGGSES